MPTESGSDNKNKKNRKNTHQRNHNQKKGTRTLHNNNHHDGTTNNHNHNNSTSSSSRRGNGGQDASHLLNFHTTTKHGELLSQHSRIRRTPKKKNHNRESAAELRTRRHFSSKFFLHASRSHGFVLDPHHDPGNGSINTTNGRYAGPDEAIPWSAVRAVRCLVETPLEEDDNHGATIDSSNNVCPICLDQFVCPRIGTCGHAFCLPCIMRHLVGDEQKKTTTNSSNNNSNNNSKNVFMNKCPCCATLMSLEELRPVHFVTVGNCQNKKKKMHFTKLHRAKGCFAPYLPNSASNCSNCPHKYVGPNAAPTVFDSDAKFSRFNYLDHDTSWYYRQILQPDIQALQTEIKCTSPLDQTSLMYLNMALQSIQYYPTELRLHPDSKLQQQQLHPTEVHHHKEPSTTTKYYLSKSYLEKDCTHFYQSSDGQLCFLSGFNMHCLASDYSAMHPTTGYNYPSVLSPDDHLHNEDGDSGVHNHEEALDVSPMKDMKDHETSSMMPAFPDFLEGQIIDTEHVHLTPEVRKRMPFLSHLPLYTDITFVELDLNKYLSKHTRDKLKPEMEQRRKKRNSKKNAEKRANQLAKKQEEQRIQNLKKSSHYQRIDPNDEFFHSTLPPDNSTTSPLADEFGPSLTTHVNTESSSSRSNTLTNDNRQRMSHPPNGSSTPMSFRSVCSKNGAYPSLTNNSNAFPALSSSLSNTHLTARNKTGCIGSNNAWGGNSKGGGIQSPKLTTTAMSPLTGKKKGKGNKIVLFSNGGGRGTY